MMSKLIQIHIMFTLSLYLRECEFILVTVVVKKLGSYQRQTNKIGFKFFFPSTMYLQMFFGGGGGQNFPNFNI